MINYIPRKMDIVWLDFAPQVGQEMAERRPALVITPIDYNTKTNLAVFCPITSTVRGYPFEVKVPDDLMSDVKGVILADQIKSLDWKQRNASFICQLSLFHFNLVIDRVNLFIYRVSTYTSEIVEPLKSKAQDAQIKDITLGIGQYHIEYASTFPQQTAFQGYLITEVALDIFADESNFTVGYIVQQLYYSETHQKIIVYLREVGYTGYEEASILELKNLRELINKYPSLSEKLGLPVPLPPDVISLEEAIDGYI